MVSEPMLQPGDLSSCMRSTGLQQKQAVVVAAVVVHGALACMSTANARQS
jgi:hypothetical protein